MVWCTTSGPRRGQRSPEGGLRWGAFAPRRASRHLPDAPHRAACRSYPRGKSAPMKQVIINAAWYYMGLPIAWGGGGPL